MKTYVPVKKLMKIVATQRLPKRDRQSSLQESIESSIEPRRRRFKWKPWAALFGLSSVLVYLYAHKTHYRPYRRILVHDRYYNEAPAPIEDDYHPHELSSTTENQIVFHYFKPNIPTKPPIIGEYKHKLKDQDLLDLGMDVPQKFKELPFCFRKKPYPKYDLVNLTSVNLTHDNIYPLVVRGGTYRPSNCKSRFKVAILVPYRKREHNLGVFLNNIHPFLMLQLVDYQIFVIEQYGHGLFNKGRVLNAGFKEMMKFNNFHCVIFHDLDLLPQNENIMYNCPTLPRHMCSYVNDTEVKKHTNTSYKFKSLFGGVVALTIEQFERANGFSNLYFGWGGEDNDLYWRLRAAGYPVVRLDRSIGVYVVLPHEREKANPYRHHLLSRVTERYKVDGLSNIEYYVITTKFRHLCTHIVIDINPRKENITELNLKWGISIHKI